LDGVDGQQQYSEKQISIKNELRPLS
jgi:hypothetical protein